jgi:hypothetical protein
MLHVDADACLAATRACQQRGSRRWWTVMPGALWCARAAEQVLAALAEGPRVPVSTLEYPRVATASAAEQVLAAVEASGRPVSTREYS